MRIFDDFYPTTFLESNHKASLSGEEEMDVQISLHQENW